MRGRTREPLANSSVTASTSTPTCIGRQQFGDKPTPSPPWTNRLIQWSLQESCNKERIRACAQVIQNKLVMERETGLEPATSSLGSWHSTTELLPPSVKPASSLSQLDWLSLGPAIPSVPPIQLYPLR